MPNVKFRASRRTLTSHAGLSIIGQCLETAGVDSIEGRFPTTLGMRTSDVGKSYLGLLCLGISDYDAIENFRRDKSLRRPVSPLSSVRDTEREDAADQKKLNERIREDAGF